jgi:hypothetical protein
MLSEQDQFSQYLILLGVLLSLFFLRSDYMCAFDSEIYCNKNGHSDHIFAGYNISSGREIHKGL